MKDNMIKSFKNSKVLILGGSGFLGSNLIQALKNIAGHIYSIQKNYIPSNNLDQNISYMYIDMSNAKKLDKAIKSIMPDYVFNVSGYIDHSPFYKGGYEVIKNQYLETMNLLDSLNGINIKSYIHTGSSDEYGLDFSPQVENRRESPMTPYSASKVAVNHILQAISKSDNFPSVILRLFIVYGPHQSKGRLIPDVITNLLSEKEINISSGKQKRDFCFVDDIVDAFLLAANSKEAIGNILNLGSGESIEVKELVQKIESKIGLGKVIYGGREIRANENLDLYPDITYAKKVLEWHPSTNIEDGLDKTINYYRKIIN